MHAATSPGGERSRNLTFGLTTTRPVLAGNNWAEFLVEQLGQFLGGMTGPILRWNHFTGYLTGSPGSPRADNLCRGKEGKRMAHQSHQDGDLDNLIFLP